MTEPSSAPSHGATVFKAVAAAGVLLAAGLGGFFGYRLLGTHPSSLRPIETPPAAGQPRQPAGESAPEASGVPARAIPERLPEISMPDGQGVTHKLSDWKGRPLIINFWATWCEPCRREIPLLKRLRRERSNQSLEVIGIAVDFPAEVTRYARQIGIDYPVLIGERDGLAAVAAFGMDTVFPFTVFGDSLGRVFTVKIGELRQDEADLILDRLHDVDAGRLSLAAARQQLSEALEHLAIQHAAGDAAKPPSS